MFVFDTNLNMFFKTGPEWRSKRGRFLFQLVYHIIQMTKQERILIRIAIISFDISIVIQSHKRQGEPTRVRNSHQEPARANESKPEPPSWYSKYPEWLSKRGHFLCQLVYHMTPMTRKKRTLFSQLNSLSVRKQSSASLWEWNTCRYGA